MKRMIKPITTLLLVFILTMSCIPAAFAAESTVTYYGKEKGFDFGEGSQYTTTDLFDGFKDVMPGNTYNETITIQNKATDCDYINLYLRAEPHDEARNPLTYSESAEYADGKDQAGIIGERDESVATMTDFLSQLTMRIYAGSRLIYEASPDEPDGLKDNVSLGKISKGETVQLKVELDVPIELGNEYANRVGEVDWIFTAEAGTSSKTPFRTIPKTGDIILIVLAVLVVSGVALVIILVVHIRRKKRHGGKSSRS